MAVGIAKGTKEIIPVDIDDSTGAVATLTGLSPKYDFLDSADVFIYNQATATNVGMRMDCLIDASSTGPSGLLPVGLYRLFVGFTVGTEKPRLGPIDIIIRDRS
jgi:hypothetical protein